MFTSQQDAKETIHLELCLELVRLSKSVLGLNEIGYVEAYVPHSLKPRTDPYMSFFPPLDSNFGAFTGISWQCSDNVMDCRVIQQNNKFVLSSQCSDEKLMALVAVFLTEVLSAQVVITRVSSGQSDF